MLKDFQRGVGSSDNGALKATQAGEYLARKMGIDTPFPTSYMWKLARENQVPVVRLGRRVWFRTDILDSIALGHNGRANHV